MVKILLDSGVEKEYEIEQEDGISDSMLQKAIAAFRDNFKDGIKNDTLASFALSYKEGKEIIINLTKVAIVEFYIK